MNTTAIVILLILSLTVLGFAMYSLFRVRRTIAALNRMLDNAMVGRFKESFDETEKSKLALKLSQYLSRGSNSVKKIERDRNNIKSMLSDISHQTKTPLSNILMYANLLVESKTLTEEDKQLVNEIYNQSNKLNFLIKALINASRLETGILQVNPKLNSVSQLLNNVIADHEDKSRKKNITLNIISNDSMALFDMKWTVEAIGNIVDNAIKYSPPESEITLSIIPYDQFVKINIEDQGQGIPEKEQSEIYQRFFRSPQVSDEEGVGIGLYIAREIISGQNGYIKLKSYVGQGSVFSVFIPSVTS